MHPEDITKSICRQCGISVAELTLTLVQFSGAIAVPPLASMFSLSRPNHRSISSWLAQ